jgi:hypothetical protein
MSNNYNNYYNLNNFYNRNKNYQKKKFQFQNKGNIREVEINSISQTEPSKQREKYNNKNQIDNELNQIDQFDNISKTNDDTLSITNFKQECLGCISDDIIFRDFISSQVKTLISKLEDIDFDKKFNEISNQITDVKNSIENKIEDYNKKNEEEILEIKELFEWHSINDLRKKLTILKGEKYSSNYIINNVFDFEKYYDSILSNDLKEKFLKNNKSFSEIIIMIYEDYKKNTKYQSNNSDNLNDKFWFIVHSFIKDENLDDNNENKLILNLSGTIYRIIKYFRGLSDDIIIDFGELIPFLDKKEKIDNAKKNINIVVNLLYEILSKQIEISELSNKIFAYGHFFYGYKGNNIELKEFVENSIYFDFIELN